MAEAERIELPTVVLETIIIPFNYASKYKTRWLYHIKKCYSRTTFSLYFNILFNTRTFSTLSKITGW